MPLPVPGQLATVGSNDVAGSVFEPFAGRPPYLCLRQVIPGRDDLLSQLNQVPRDWMSPDLVLHPRPDEKVHDGELRTVWRELHCPAPVGMRSPDPRVEVEVSEDLARVETPQAPIEDITKVLDDLLSGIFQCKSK